MSNKDAYVIDKEVDLSSCNLKKGEYSRYYWYDYISTETSYEITTYDVRFAVINDGGKGIHAVADIPPTHEEESKLKAFGIYSIPNNKVASLRCISN